MLAGSFGGSEIVTFDMKRVRIIYKLKGNRGSGGGADATRRNRICTMFICCNCIWFRKRNN